MTPDHIPDLDVMVKIARENQLNPLYEQVLADYDEAMRQLSCAANKLAQAVKLTDYDELSKRVTDRKNHTTSAAGILSVLRNRQATPLI